MLSCDFAYAVKTARFALTEVSLGIMPGAGGTQNLPRAVGERRAKEILMTARPFSAQQALDWGVVNELCEPGELMPKVLDTARAIAGNAPLSIRQAKKSVRYGMQMELQDRLPLRGRGLQPPDRDRGPLRGHQGLQRKAQAGVQGKMSCGRFSRATLR